MVTELDGLLSPSETPFDWMFDPIDSPDGPLYEGQEVVATIGCPGSGKSTLANKCNPREWVVLTLDDFRTAMWPPHRRTYWEVRADEEVGPRAQRALRSTFSSAIAASLDYGWNVFLADTHIKPEAFVHNVDLIRSYGIRVKWKLFKTPKDVIMERNTTRPLEHRLPSAVLDQLYDEMWRDDAWWKTIPPDQVEIVEG